MSTSRNVQPRFQTSSGCYGIFNLSNGENEMTPLHIRIMLHHYSIAEPYSNDNPEHAGSKAVAAFHVELIELEMLTNDHRSPSKFSITEKGMVYIKYLLSVPIPVTKHVIEWPLP
jgi:hypothetical protein